ncbi:MAG: D-glycerate dehydrogenase [Gemmatimonadota bacterium]|nr:D-glycerate dehydrogenase [Gemmatimonadota bacterium]
MTGRPRVVVTRRLPEAVEAALAERFDVERNLEDRPLTTEALRAALATADALLPTVTDRLSAEVFAAATGRCRVIANFGVGVNHIDLAAAARAGCLVTNTPDVLTDDTADLAILLMLAVLRGAGAGERRVRSGGWDGWGPTSDLGRRLTGKTLGVVGFGRIGQAVARRARAGFGMTVLAWSRRRPAAAALEGVTWVESLEALLPQVDVLSLHTPGGAETQHLLDAARLARLQRHAVLVNTARGDVVDEAALVAALEAGRLAGAGLDVYEREPAVHPGLLGRDDVVLLPHLGSATVESRSAMGMRALENLVAVFDGRTPPDRVG